MIRINLIRGKRKKRRELNLNFLYLLIPLLVLAVVFGLQLWLNVA